jgi:hypothetical protein
LGAHIREIRPDIAIVTERPPKSKWRGCIAVSFELAKRLEAARRGGAQEIAAGLPAVAGIAKLKLQVLDT